MAWQELFPYLAGGVQPISDTLTVISTVSEGKNIYGTLFIANVSSSLSERVRVALKPVDQPTVDLEQYILYDTDLPPNYMLQLSNIGLNSQDSVVGYSENGFAVFNFTGDEVRNYS